MTASDDPSLTDTPTLLRSLARDVAEAQAAMITANRWIQQASYTAHELQRRFPITTTEEPR